MQCYGRYFKRVFSILMNCFVRNIVLWLIMLAVSVQGVAFAAAPRCHHHAHDHAETSAHQVNGDNGDYDALSAHNHESPKNDSASTQQHASSSHDDQMHPSAKNNCCASHCGASCPFVLAQLFSLTHAALPSDRYFLIGEPLYSGFIPNVAKRPPKAVTA